MFLQINPRVSEVGEARPSSHGAVRGRVETGLVP